LQMLFLFIISLLRGIVAFIPQELLDKANLGDADAQNSIGSMSIKGDEVKKDYNLAFTWIKKRLSKDMLRRY